MPDGLLKLGSKRTTRFTAEAGPKIAEYENFLGRTLSPAERVGAVKTAVLKTRSRKQHAELSGLHATWTAEAADLGWSPGRLGGAVRLRTSPAREAAAASLAHGGSPRGESYRIYEARQARHRPHRTAGGRGSLARARRSLARGHRHQVGPRPHDPAPAGPAVDTSKSSPSSLPP